MSVNCSEFVYRITTILDVWRKSIATKSDVILITRKIKQQYKGIRIKEKHNIIYPFWSKIDLLWGREQLSVPLIKTISLHKE